ncbi:MAG: Na(+)-translocating NADH-quinone reductase subunit C, partial [Bacteroidales bacterium]|nr:Na(+)-translocating NADH-quinone reductase subunit C [Bacteroidales bacterium]
MFSNKYIYIYTTIMVVAVAALLALAATLLKPFQDKNARVETMQNILKAAGIASTAEDAEALYVGRIREELTVNAGGEVLARYGSDGALLDGAGARAFDISMKNALEAGEEGAFPVFVCRKDGEDGYIVPLYGKGLWGPIWGYITFAPDMNTVLG